MSELSPKQLEAGHQSELDADIAKIETHFRSSAIAVPNSHQLMKELAQLKANKQLTKDQQKREQELNLEIAQLYGLESGLWAANFNYAKFNGALGKMRQRIVEDYGCQTALEFMLADRIVGSYWRANLYEMRFSRILVEEDGRLKGLSQLDVNFLKELNRGLEMANRQLSANIMLLKDLRQPALSVKVNTKNAYIAQNQQVVNKDGAADKETIIKDT